ncbi:IclR family transcriptional regulator domain-containing protein [Bradyrhizobium liaoningense]|uniref:IclR family transcriptional regulator domain-containing protein n=1 Tax=Bradyrhizobium liaoningense TaxID=43992 RepID=UPI001BABD735|nr:IclR family transcriptional regulator C-terminal domain-containing protein [Bradyrhizobium liaoningense]MBR0706944.1 helix-turn-helix domain-containing protein [Bradyrhizobium liaoningense]
MTVKRVKRTPSSEPRRPAEGMGGLAKGLAIIEALSSFGVQSAADAARAAQSTRAAARRCLLTLVELGYVERVGREFKPLPRLRNLGQPGSLRDRLIETSASILASGRDKLNESVSLAVLEGESVLFVARAEAEHIVSTGVRIGARLPAYCSATGRVLLGALADQDIRGIIGSKTLAQRTPKTIVKPTLLLQEINQSRASGFALCDEELELGMRAMAVPVRDIDGKIVAALSVSAYTARINRKVFLTQFLDVIRDCAAQLEEQCFGRRRPSVDEGK